MRRLGGGKCDQRAALSRPPLNKAPLLKLQHFEFSTVKYPRLGTNRAAQNVGPSASPDVVTPCRAQVRLTSLLRYAPDLRRPQTHILLQDTPKAVVFGEMLIVSIILEAAVAAIAVLAARQGRPYLYGLAFTFAAYVLYDLARLMQWPVEAPLLSGLFLLASVAALVAVVGLYKAGRKS
jgi:hypothetical protein